MTATNQTRSQGSAGSSLSAQGLPRVVWSLALGLLLMLGWLSWPQASWAREASAIQPYLDRVEGQVNEFTLDNGMKFIVLERHRAPVVSFMIHAKVGAVDEVDGKTGVAHYLEHMAFKGTQNIGTRDYAAEQGLFQQMDDVFDQILVAREAGNTEQVEALEAELDQLQAEAATHVIQNEFGQIVEGAGGVGLNATTSADATRYFYSLPSNKLELWMSLESERFLEPVFREFHEERQVILEERRMRVDNSPIGKMIETLQDTAFQAHPYRRPIIGYQVDIENTTRQDIQDFYQVHYGPDNLIAAVVGDVETAQVRQLAETYFGRYEQRQPPPMVTVEEPPQTEPRKFTLTLPSQPWYLAGFHRPAITDGDNQVYAMIDSLLVQGRTSRLYQALVEDQQLALNVGCLNGFPGNRYPSLFLFYALTAPGQSTAAVASALETQIERLRTEPVSAAELERVKTQAQAGLLRSLSSDRGMASLLTEYEAKTGSWRNVFDELAQISAVTAADVQRVAAATFRPENRTVGELLPQS